MAISVFDLFTIGIGPSSSHTVGPMRAARRFATRIFEADLGDRLAGLRISLHGSLAWTGRGHGTGRAVVLGLEGATPEEIDPDRIEPEYEAVARDKALALLGRHRLAFDLETDLVFDREEVLPLHSNGMRFRAVDAGGEVLLERVYYSVGGGFVVDEGMAEDDLLKKDRTDLPHPLTTGDDLVARTDETGLSIANLMLANETCWRSESEVRARLLAIWRAMAACVERGCRQEGVLPGGLGVKRRAPELFRSLTIRPEHALTDPLTILDWVNLYALATNEENAAGGRVVTAPTNGAAGIVPAVLHYYVRFCPGAGDSGIVDYLLTAGAIGILYKQNASISGAEVGCQGEVGVASSMAAGGLTAALGGSPRQVENAAEIGMEHNLGLTCDPIGGLVQIPCIERNAMGAIKAINAYRIAMRGNGEHFVSLDKVMRTMRQTGADMAEKYKETSRGGLAVNVIEC